MKPAMPLRMIGAQRIIAPETPLDEESLSFYINFFERIRTVRDAIAPARYLRFDSRGMGEGQWQFIGVEVDEISRLPEGMVGWTLSGDRWRIHGAGEAVPEHVAAIQWNWFGDTEIRGRGRRAGEFHVCGAADGVGSIGSQDGSVWLSANAYTDWGREIEGGDSVNLVQYDPLWPGQYSEFAEWLGECLGPDLARRIEHFGSTAIPGMPAKPVIDVAIEIPSFDEARRKAIPLLNREEWEYWWDGGHMMFIRRDGFMGRRTHHVHMAPSGHPFWQRLAFRDYLRTHSREAMNYAQLKMDLAERHQGDREHYTMAKGRFVREMTAKALEWQKGDA